MTKQAYWVEEPTPVLEAAIVDENSSNLYRTNYDLIDDQNGWERNNQNNFEEDQQYYCGDGQIN